MKPMCSGDLMDNNVRKHFYRLVFIVFILVSWEILARSGIFDQNLFPGMISVIRRLYELITKESLLIKTAYSISLVLLSMIASLVISTVLIILGRKFEWIGTNIELVNSVASPLPGIAILPLVILWLGVRQESMLFIMIHATLWPMWRQLSLGVDRLHTRYKRFEKAFGLSPLRRFYHIYCLGSTEDLIAAMSVSWSRGWRALISVEMIFGIVGTQTGLGWMIFERRMYMDTEGLYAGLIMIALCGVLFESLIFRKRNLRRTT